VIHLFAQTEYSAPAAFQGWIECLFFAAALLGALAFTKNQVWPPKEKKQVPQPLVVAPQPSYADKQETEHRFKQFEQKIEASRIENRDEMQKLRQEAVEGRRGLHKDIERNADKIADKFGEFSIEITNAVGELRGEMRRISK
jgi:hypothetical protein